MTATTEPPENQNNRPRKSRLESEIEEILARSEAESPLPPPTPIRAPRKEKQLRQSPERDSLQSAATFIRRWLDAAPLLVAFLLAIIALMISGISPLLATVAAMLSVVAVFYPIIAQSRQSNQPGEKMWRGRPYHVSPIEPTPFERFRQWLRNRNILP